MTPQEAAVKYSVGDRFQHYKGGIYTFLYIGRHSETEAWFVIYKNAGGDVWIRPFAMFFERVERNGTAVPRFSPLEE